MLIDYIAVGKELYFPLSNTNISEIKINILTQYHYMNIIAKTLRIVNPNETLIDVCDQPVYKLTKQIQWQYLDLFGTS